MTDRRAVLLSFRVTGELDGRTVSAEWADGALIGDDALIARAGLVLAIEDAMNDTTLTAPISGRWAVALIRTVDRVLDADARISP